MWESEFVRFKQTGIKWKKFGRLNPAEKLTESSEDTAYFSKTSAKVSVTIYKHFLCIKIKILVAF